MTQVLTKPQAATWDLAPPKRTNRQAPRRIAILFILAGLTLFACLLSLRVGSLTISWHDAVGAIFNYHGPKHSPIGEIVVRALRVPRTFVGLGVGIALGVTGALMQGLTRNPMADPGILGINAGAALAITLAYLFGFTTYTTYVWFAFLGAALVAALGYGLASIGGGATPMKMVLAGAILASFVGAFISAINVLNPNIALSTVQYLAGNVAGVPLNTFLETIPFFGVGLLIALGSGKALNGLALGDEVARSLGQRLALTRSLVALSVILMAGAAVALTGGIAFVGLMVPHIARWFVGPDYRWIIPASALLGPVVVLFCDVAGRVVAEPGEVQVGIMVALVGAPFFIYVARRRRIEGL